MLCLVLCEDEYSDGIMEDEDFDALLYGDDEEVDVTKEDKEVEALLNEDDDAGAKNVKH